MNKEQRFTNEALEKRIERGEVTLAELRSRAELVWEETVNDLPHEVAGELGCPVCLSRLPYGSRLVRNPGYIVCDYCVNYVEDYEKPRLVAHS
jgi:hypothetical protein